MSRLTVRLSLCIICAISASTSQAQSASGTTSITMGKESRATAIHGQGVITDKSQGAAKVPAATGNPWVAGAQIGYKFAGKGDFADNVFAAGTVIYNLQLDPTESHGWNIPIFSNVASLAADASGKTAQDSLQNSANAMLNSAQGILLKLAPYRTFHDATNTRLRLLTSVGGKINSLAAKDTAAGKETLLQGRVGAGFEMEIGMKADEDGNRPIVLSGSLLQSFFSATSYEKVFGERKSELTVMELSAIVPVQKGTGMVIEAALAQGLPPALRIGLLVARSEK